MQPHKTLFVLFAAAILSSCCQKPLTSSLRAPSYPLVTIDPYTSAWSPSDELYGSVVEHWTGFPFPLTGVLTVDGQSFRFLGKEKTSEFRAVAAGAREHPWDGEYSLDGGISWKAGKGGYGPERRKPMTATWLDCNRIDARRRVAAEDIASTDDLYLMCTSKGSAEFKVNGSVICSTDDNQELRFFPIPAEVAARNADGSILLEGRVNSEARGVVIDMGLYEKICFEERYPVTAVQTGASVLPMNTVYNFVCGPVDLELTFTAPLFLDRLDLVSRPVNYISYRIKSNDGKAHNASVRFEAGREWALDYAIDETSEADTCGTADIIFASTACTDQNPLWKSGDGVRIDWGRFYLAAERAGSTAEAGPDGDIAVERNIGCVKSAEGKIMVGYDDILSIRYFGENLRPYWNADGTRSIEDEFAAALEEYPTLMKESASFDRELMNKAASTGGQKYAELCALAYRQAISAHKLVISPDREILWLSKENNSNGSIGTVDVSYPSAPLFLLYNNELTKGLLNPIFHYSESGLWTKPYPSHDVGRYPIADGMRYGADMPVEEAGNMLILTAAVCTVDGSADYAAKHWDMLSLWAGYLLEFGLDPDNQLCTDDFAGKSAHNVNLSAKAILGLASYGRMAEMLGYDDIAASYGDKAREMASSWMEMADDGDHYRLMFDQAGGWSQKYNIIWDDLLGLGIFPDSVMQRETEWYLTHQNVYGLPLDSRSAYTKTDWILWTATMSGNRDNFEALVEPVWNFYNETVDRIPMGDWVWSDKPEHVQFKARSVVGGFYIKLLKDKLHNTR